MYRFLRFTENFLPANCDPASIVLTSRFGLGGTNGVYAFACSLVGDQGANTDESSILSTSSKAIHSAGFHEDVNNVCCSSSPSSHNLERIPNRLQRYVRRKVDAHE
jgi:hypothetical protein